MSLAADNVRRGTSSYDIPINLITISSLAKKLEVKIDEVGKLVPTGGLWILNKIPLSSDIHSCSVVLERGYADKTLRLVATKDLRRGQELSLWFSQDVLAAMDVPFLNPINIQGEKTYKCHRCGVIFEYPNPLKLHLALNCSTSAKIDDLWHRLADSLTSPTINSIDFNLKLTLKETKTDFRSPSPSYTSYSTPSPDRAERSEDDNRPSSEPPRNSAFKPYLSHHFKEDFLNHQAAEIETLVSNLGQSKQGHLCLYCGKIYSRKYGLKIHIRTHTGFKPLKCKYCLRPFGDPSNLNKHVRLHSDSETPYRCNLCGKMLVRRRDLERHLKARHNTDVK